MKVLIRHEGWIGSVHYNSDDRIFYGKIEFIRALARYEVQDADSLEAAFHEAVDDYQATCVEPGHEPEKPFDGFIQ